MEILRTTLIPFSPTRTTCTVLEAVARGLTVDAVELYDLTRQEAKTRRFQASPDQLVIMGAPVYAGRIPAEAVRRLLRLEGNGAPAVVVVMYGNRAYEDALLELKDVAIRTGFRPIAGGAFIGEHSFSTGSKPIAHGRPDDADLAKAVEFGAAIARKFRGSATLAELGELSVPGNIPYRDSGLLARICPVTREDQCIKCGTCASACPMAAITVGETVSLDQDACIACCACVKNCPTGSRVMEHPQVGKWVQWLTTTCGDRREPEVFGV